MNGRVYDAALGRFISADPVIKEGFSSQNFSRYSYVLNAPNKYTDPSGFTQESSYGSVQSYGNWDWGNGFNTNTAQNTALNTALPGPVRYNATSQEAITNQNVSTIYTNVVSSVLGGLSSGFGAGPATFDQMFANGGFPYSNVFEERYEARFDPDMPCAACPFTPMAPRTASELLVDGLEEAWRLSQGIPVEGQIVGGVKFGVSLLAIKKAPVHHICTNKNCISTLRGGPWTPKFEIFFKNAGLNIDGSINKVAVLGHKGPHPLEYHSYVYDQLVTATFGLSAKTNLYRDAVESTLSRIKVEATTPGHPVNRWLTKE